MCSFNGFVCVTLPGTTSPRPPIASHGTLHINVHPTVGFPYYSGAKKLKTHDQVRNGMAQCLLLLFVGSTQQLMANDHKVNMKMECMTDQTHHDSFIIMCQQPPRCCGVLGRERHAAGSAVM